MNPSFWKKWLSYLVEVPIESRSSTHNDYLQVSLVRGRYQLCTDNAIYSFGDLYSNFRQAFEQVRLEDYPIQKVLILGFGLASIPLMLETVFQKHYHYTGVEVDEEVLDLANSYVLPKLTSPRQLICGDAYTFVQTCQEQFDMIAVDLFVDNVVPEKFESVDFLENLARILAPGGLLLYNRLADGPKDRESTQVFFEDQFRQVFTKARYLEVERNWMLLSQ